MRRNSYKKIIVICVLILFLFLAITNTIISNDAHRIGHCEMEHCPKCVLINSAVNFINTIFYASTMLLIIALVIPIIEFLNIRSVYLKGKTLVDYKVRLNE